MKLKIYIIECKISKINDNSFYPNSYQGEHLLECMGTINTNVYYIKNFGNHIELRYKIGKIRHCFFKDKHGISSYEEDIEKILLSQNYQFFNNNPRDILQITSFEYKNISENKNNSFILFGQTFNKKIIRNIGQKSKLLNLGIKFFGGFYKPDISSLCYLYPNNNDFIIDCYLDKITWTGAIISSVYMSEEYIYKENNEYDIILPFEFEFTFYPSSNEPLKEGNPSNNLSKFQNLFFIKILMTFLFSIILL